MCSRYSWRSAPDAEERYRPARGSPSLYRPTPALARFARRSRGLVFARFHLDETVGEFGKLAVKTALCAGLDGRCERTDPGPEVLVEETFSKTGHCRQRFRVVIAARLIFPVNEQIEKLHLGRNVIGQFAKIFVNLESALLVHLEYRHRGVPHEGLLSLQPDRSVRLGDDMGGAEEKSRVIDQQALGSFGGEFLAQPARARRKVRVNPRRGIEHRIEDLLFREFRARLVVACRQKAAEVLASCSLLLIVIWHPDS